MKLVCEDLQPFNTAKETKLLKPMEQLELLTYFRGVRKKIKLNMHWWEYP